MLDQSLCCTPGESAFSPFCTSQFKAELKGNSCRAESLANGGSERRADTLIGSSARGCCAHTVLYSGNMVTGPLEEQEGRGVGEGVVQMFLLGFCAIF